MSSVKEQVPGLATAARITMGCMRSLVVVETDPTNAIGTTSTTDTTADNMSTIATVNIRESVNTTGIMIISGNSTSKAMGTTTIGIGTIGTIIGTITIGTTTITAMVLIRGNEGTLMVLTTMSHRYNARRASEEYEQARARARRFEERYTRQSFSVPRYGFAGRGPHGSHAFDPRSNYHGFAGGHNSRFPEDEFAAADPIHGMGSRHRHGGRHNHRHHEANVPPYANTRHDPLWGSDEDEPSLFDDPADDEPDFSDFEYNGFQGDQSEDDDRPNQGAHGFRGRNAFGEESGWGRHEPASPDQGGDGRTHYDVLGVPRDVEQATLEKAAKVARVKAHPDKKIRPGMTPEEKQMIHDEAARIGQAADILLDPMKRAEYDHRLRRGQF
ncbi:hypothetical protein MMC16_007046 [Acarospora aff. strigata]|nr:hypothetical protein [Acarospora aff. strigata]